MEKGLFCAGTWCSWLYFSIIKCQLCICKTVNVTIDFWVDSENFYFMKFHFRSLNHVPPTQHFHVGKPQITSSIKENKLLLQVDLKFSFGITVSIRTTSLVLFPFNQLHRCTVKELFIFPIPVSLNWVQKQNCWINFCQLHVWGGKPERAVSHFVKS